MKKNLFSKINMLVLLAGALSLSSCLKDSRFVDFSKVGTLIELPLSAVSEFQAQSYPITSTPAALPVVINVAAPTPLSSALPVTLIIDTAAITAYNKANGTSFTLLPSSDYTVSSLKATIPANQRTATVTFNIITTAIDPSGSYILPVTIGDASGQKISNYKTVLYNVQVKNKYDGQYTVTGTMTDNVNSALTGSYPRTVDLITQGANSVGYFDTGIGGYAHAILSSGSASYYGSFAPVFNFDPTTNKVVSVVNYYGQPAGNTRSARIDVTGINALSGTPGTAGSVIQVKYVLVQTSVGGDRTFFNETFTYVGTR